MTARRETTWRCPWCDALHVHRCSGDTHRTPPRTPQPADPGKC